MITAVQRKIRARKNIFILQQSTGTYFNNSHVTFEIVHRKNARTFKSEINSVVSPSPLLLRKPSDGGRNLHHQCGSTFITRIETEFQICLTDEFNDTVSKYTNITIQSQAFISPTVPLLPYQKVSPATLCSHSRGTSHPLSQSRNLQPLPPPRSYLAVTPQGSTR